VTSREIRAYVNATVLLELARRRELYGEPHALPLPAPRNGDSPHAARGLEGSDRIATDQVPAHGLRGAEELPAAQPGVSAGAGEGDEAPEEVK
jgi:hypothetical protein